MTIPFKLSADKQEKVEEICASMLSTFTARPPARPARPARAARATRATSVSHRGKQAGRPALPSMAMLGGAAAAAAARARGLGPCAAPCAQESFDDELATLLFKRVRAELSPAHPSGPACKLSARDPSAAAYSQPLHAGWLTKLEGSKWRQRE